jgi:hypothetical protein
MFKIKKVQPLFTGIVTTAQRYVGTVVEKNGLLIPNKQEGKLNLFQTVVSVGPMVSGIKEGDIVKLNYKRYLVPKQVPGKIENNIQSSNIEGTYEIPSIDIEGIQYLFLQNNDVEFVVTEYELDEGGLLQ